MMSEQIPPSNTIIVVMVGAFATSVCVAIIFGLGAVYVWNRISTKLKSMYVDMYSNNSSNLIMPLNYRKLSNISAQRPLPKTPSPPPPVDLVQQLQEQLGRRNMLYLKHHIHVTTVIGEGNVTLKLIFMDSGMCFVYHGCC